MKYYINGFTEGRSYFLSFGFTEKEIERMKNGEIISREQNEFWMEADDEKN